MKSRDKSKVESMGGHGAEGEVGDKEGVAVKDGKGGKERVWEVKRGSVEEDLEVVRGGGDGFNGEFFM